MKTDTVRAPPGMGCGHTTSIAKSLEIHGCPNAMLRLLKR
jgi:hypothetical protein